MMQADREAAIRSAVDALVTALLAAVAPEPADAPDRLLSVAEAAAALGVGRSRLYDEIGAGRLRSLVVGRRRLVPSGAIGDYIRAGVDVAPAGPRSPDGGRDRSIATSGIPARRRPGGAAA